MVPTMIFGIVLNYPVRSISNRTGSKPDWFGDRIQFHHQIDMNWIESFVMVSHPLISFIEKFFVQIIDSRIQVHDVVDVISKERLENKIENRAWNVLLWEKL